MPRGLPWASVAQPAPGSYIAAAYKRAGQARLGRAGNKGRPRGGCDMVSGDEIPDKVGAQLDADDAVTSKTFVEELGPFEVTAIHWRSELGTAGELSVRFGGRARAYARPAR